MNDSFPIDFHYGGKYKTIWNTTDNKTRRTGNAEIEVDSRSDMDDRGNHNERP